jgi:hypothetical protein
LFAVDANKHDLEKKKQVTQNMVKACGAWSRRYFYVIVTRHGVGIGNWIY